MGCCSTNDETPLKEIKPYDKRSCTDVLFLLAFLAFWGGTGTVIYLAGEKGANANFLIHGMDHTGQVCGTGDAVDRPVAAWVYPPEYSYMVCVESCNVTSRDQQTNGNAVSWRLSSTQVGYYCLPNLPPEAIDISIKFSGSFNADVGTRSLADIWTAGPMILGSAGVALIMAFVYTWLCKHCAGFLVWSCVLLTIAGGAASAYVLINKAAEIETEGVQDDDRAKALKWVGYGIAVITGIFMLVILFLRKQIALAIAVVKETSKVMEDIPMLIVFPVFPIIAALVYFGFWLYTAVYIYSVGDLSDPVQVSSSYVTNDYNGPTPGAGNGNTDTFVRHVFDESFQNYLIAHCFGFLWNIQFLVYLGYTVIAGAVADWYFSAGSDRGALLRSPITASLARTLRFHLGSIALGSLVIAVIQAARATLAYVQKQATSEDPNGLQKAVLCCVQCLLRCLECCIDKVSKDGYVWMSIWGDGFCTSTCSAFSLIWRNLARVAALNVVGGYLVGLGKFTVAVLTTGIFAVVFVHTDYVDELSSPVLPCVCIFIMSWSVAYLFMIVFETVLDATFLCFLVDYEHNKGGFMMASRGLQSLVGEHAASSEHEAKRRYKAKRRMMGRSENSETLL